MANNDDFMKQTLQNEIEAGRWPLTVPQLLRTIHANQLVMMGMISKLITMESKMAVDLTAITAEVANQTTVDSSIETLVANIAAQLTAISSGSGDAATQAALNALVATMTQNDTAIATAVTTNTPAAPASSQRQGQRPVPPRA